MHQIRFYLATKIEKNYTRSEQTTKKSENRCLGSKKGLLLPSQFNNNNQPLYHERNHPFQQSFEHG